MTRGTAARASRTCVAADPEGLTGHHRRL